MAGIKRSASFERDTAEPSKRPCPENSSSGKAGEGKCLACPFYVKNPFKYFECRPREPSKTRSSNMFKPDRLADLTQHFGRTHTATSLRCSTCGMEFEGKNQQGNFEKHCRQAGAACQRTAYVEAGVSLYEMEQIKNLVKGASPKDRWNKIWHILFGKEAQPPRLKSAPWAIPGNGLVDAIDWIQSFSRPCDLSSSCARDCRKKALDEICKGVIESPPAIDPTLPAPTGFTSLTAPIDPTSSSAPDARIDPEPNRGAPQQQSNEELPSSVYHGESDDLVFQLFSWPDNSES